MSRKIVLRRPEVGKISLASSPCHHRRRWSGVVPLGLGLGCSVSATASSSGGDDADRSGKLGKRSGCRLATHGSIRGSWPSAFLGCPRGYRDYTEAKCQWHCAPTGVKDTHSRTRASQEPTGHHQRENRGDGRALHRRRSSGLRFQFLNVEVFSLLP